MGGEFLFNYRLGACREGCDIGIYAMRACGIPTAIDRYIHSTVYQGSHTWNVVRDTTGHFLPFWYKFIEVFLVYRIIIRQMKYKIKLSRLCSVIHL